MTRASMTTAAGAVILVLAAPGSRASAQTGGEPALISRPVQDSLVASWQLDRNSAAGPGRGFSIDWVRQLNAGRVITAGAGSFALGESHWTLARIGWAFRPHERLTLSTQTTLGGGETAGAPFGHRAVRADLAIPATGKASVLLGDEYLKVADAHGHFLRVGTAVRVSKLVIVEGTRAASAGGNLNTTLSIGRVELLTAPVSFAGGGVFGRVTPELVAFTGGPAAGGQQLGEAFVGVAFPIRRTTARVTFDTMRLAGVTRRTLTMTAAIPVGR